MYGVIITSIFNTFELVHLVCKKHTFLIHFHYPTKCKFFVLSSVYVMCHQKESFDRYGNAESIIQSFRRSRSISLGKKYEITRPNCFPVFR